MARLVLVKVFVSSEFRASFEQAKTGRPDLQEPFADLDTFVNALETRKDMAPDTILGDVQRIAKKFTAVDSSTAIFQFPEDLLRSIDPTDALKTISSVIPAQLLPFDLALALKDSDDTDRILKDTDSIPKDSNDADRLISAELDFIYQRLESRPDTVPHIQSTAQDLVQETPSSLLQANPPPVMDVGWGEVQNQAGTDCGDEVLLPGMTLQPPQSSSQAHGVSP